MKYKVFLLVFSIVFLMPYTLFANYSNGNHLNNHGWYQDYCQDVNIGSVRDRLLSSDPSAKLHAAHKILKAPLCYGISLSQLAEDIVAKYADRGSITFLLKILKQKIDHKYNQGLDINVRALAAFSIGRIVNKHIEDRHNEDKLCSDNIVKALIKTLGSSYDLRIRIASAQALGDVRDVEAIPALQAIVSDQNENSVLQFVAMQSLDTLESVTIQRNHEGWKHSHHNKAMARDTDPPTDYTPNIADAARNYLLFNFAPAYIKLMPQK